MEKNQIQHLAYYSFMGILWLNESWFSFFKNLVKIGLTENVSEIFLFATNFLLSQKNFEVLIKVFENLIPSIFSNLLFEKLSSGTIKIFEFYIIGAPSNSTLMEKIIQKIMGIFPKILDNKMIERLLLICECILKKYQNVLEIPNFIIFVENAKACFLLKSDPTIIQGLINSTDWLNSSKVQNEIKFRGLMNLGNSKKIYFILKI